MGKQTVLKTDLMVVSVQNRHPKFGVWGPVRKVWL